MQSVLTYNADFAKLKTTIMRGIIIFLMMVFFSFLSNSVFADTIVQTSRGNEYRIETRNDIEKIKMIINCRETKDNGR